MDDTTTRRLDADTLKEVVGFVFLAVGVAATIWGIDHEWGRAWACMIGGILCAFFGLALLPKAGELAPPNESEPTKEAASRRTP